LREYVTSDCSDWYTRFGICPELDIFALGNSDDNVSIFSISGLPEILNNKPSVSQSGYAITNSIGIIKTKVDDNDNDEVESKTIKERCENLTTFNPQTVLHGDEIKKKVITRQVAFFFDKLESYLAVASQDASIKLWHIDYVKCLKTI
jgi:hypothetical protein